MTRPYINFSAAELKQAVDDNINDISILKGLVHEIGYRKKGRKNLALHLEKAKRYIKKSTLSEQKKIIESTDITKIGPKKILQKVDGRNIEKFGEPVPTDLSAEILKEHALKKIVDKPINTEKKSEKGFIREASSSLKNLPQAWFPESKETFKVRGLCDAKTNSEMFIFALSGLIWEIRKGAKYSKQIGLTNGQRQKSISGEYGYVYSFYYGGNEDLFEGARIEFQAASKKTKGSIVSMLSGNSSAILISLDEDFGSIISQCTITQDETALLESLQMRLEIEEGINSQSFGSPVGMNTDLADSVLKGKTKKINISDFIIDTSGLNEGQKSFIRKALGHSTSFLWGPPGTGKTQTLGAILSCFFKINDRSLICSNTNQAVDQVLLKLCKYLKNQGQISDLENGKIVRLGRISQAELVDEFRQYVTVDGIADRKGQEITSKIDELEIKKSNSEIKISKCKLVIDQFKNLTKSKKQKIENAENLKLLSRRIKEFSRRSQNIIGKLENLKFEKLDYENKGIIGKALSRGISSINQEYKAKEQENADLERLIESLKGELDNSRIKQKVIESELGGIIKLTDPLNLDKAESDLKEEEKKVTKFNHLLADLKKQIEDIRKTILDEATIVGATLTKTFLSPAELGKFDNIVIDEASMGILPAIYFASSQSASRCIISGDFRQLSPIVQSKNKTILDILGSDIFSYSGMQANFEKKVKCDHADVLREQYRMDSKICNLISEIGYEGELVTSKNREVIPHEAPKLFEDSVIIVDSSSLYPFAGRDPFGSTSNMVHALLARNIMRNFSDLKNSGNIGYCAPFKAQVKLMNKISNGEPYEKNVSIGTVHTFQGDEKNTMIFDTVDSLGERHYLNPSLAQETPSKSNLLTVAVSRSEYRLILIANLRYLDSKIPALGYLRKILFNAQSNGTVIDAKEIIDLFPLQKEIKKYEVDIQRLELPKSVLKSGLVNEDVFFPLLEQDLKKAKKYIAIYTGFYTSYRVNKLISIFRSNVKSGVKVRIILPPPDRNGSMDETESTMVAEMLEKEGIIIEFRARIHQKSVLIDDDIVWFGSLNPLSFSGKTEESMLRIEQEKITGTFASNMAINRKTAKDDPSLMVSRELPDCSFCGMKVVFHRGRHGPYVKCRSCKKSDSLKNF